MLQHFTKNDFVQAFDFVQLFFVLSGYLITRILVRYSNEYNLKDAAIEFYWRRILRLAPALYVGIGSAYLLGISGMRDDWWIHGLYLTNFQIAASGQWSGAGHFWSLSVEEQFYIIWFFVVCLIRGRYLPRVVLATILLALASRVILSSVNVDLFSAGPGVLLPLKSDALGYGAAIALSTDRTDRPSIADILCSPYILALSATLTISGIWTSTWEWMQPILATAVTILCASIVAAAVRSSTSLLNWLEWAPLRNIGVISYGVYVYHFFVPEIWRVITTRLAVPPLGHRANSLIFLTISLALGALSWHFIEKPILRWRDRTDLPRKILAGVNR